MKEKLRKTRGIFFGHLALFALIALTIWVPLNIMTRSDIGRIGRIGRMFRG